VLRNQISAFNTVLTRVTYGRLRRVTNVSYRSVPGVYFIQACVSLCRTNINMKLCCMNSFMHLQSAYYIGLC